MNLYLTRHGETIWNIEKRFQGNKKNSPLTEKGQQQAQWLSEALRNIDFEAIYSSPSGRTMTTAQIIKGDRQIDIIPLDELREINMGDWEGQDYAKVEVDDPEQYKAFWTAPHLFSTTSGETFTALHDRVLPAIKSITEKHKGNVLVVTHAITLKTIMCWFEDKPLENFWDPPFIYPTSISMVEIEPDGHIIHLHGDISHFRDED